MYNGICAKISLRFYYITIIIAFFFFLPRRPEDKDDTRGTVIAAISQIKQNILSRTFL